MNISEAIVFLGLLYFLVSLLVRIRKFSGSIKRFALIIIVLLGIDVFLKGVEMLYNHSLVSIVSSLALFGVFVILSLGLKHLEAPPMKVQQVKVSMNGENSGFVGAYIIPGSRSRIVDLINMIKELNAPVLVFTRYPSFYRNLGENIRVVWITQASEDGIPPTKLHVIQDYAIRFARENKNAVIIIDCLEYLLLYNEFSSVFKFLANLKDHLVMMNSALILAVDQKALETKYYNMLLNEFEPL
ncbi:DUF835 domain-containing protein [Pyrococcus abyssi]|uniref:DUF835 domain-containing protein n=1 Tax=Pyrococcus abyssi (strain GE5 / Orsay) TaxID=272844 RepID=Q9V1X3_PYRAB|nr:DUF835 domain-containing protein [Pyrococcus abyssi]CAB49225.1 Hypothetical protein PAB0205 [Pyrococcus abyssi GE5]CCE69679.1 TPA: hypothetical protein PAB0205 [Pyrococcus abyssi GE5]